MGVFAEGRDFAGGDIVGDRKGQEDFHAFLMLEAGDGLLAILADGMGGHAAGEVASRLAVESFARSFQRPGSETIPVRLGAALQAADNAIAGHIAAHPDKAGMGCTLLAAHFSPLGLHWLSVGDSPLYLARKGKITQINQDHSMAPEIEKSLKAGRISEAEARNHPHRNALRSAVMGEGYSKLVDSPSKPLALSAGDMVVLASDGVQTLSVKEIGDHLKSHAGLPLTENVSRLLWAVQRKKRPNQDNTTVQLIRVPAAMATRKRRRPGVVAAIIGLGLSMLALAGLGAFAVQKWTDDKTETPITEPSNTPRGMFGDRADERLNDGVDLPKENQGGRNSLNPKDNKQDQLLDPKAQPSGRKVATPRKNEKAEKERAEKEKAEKEKAEREKAAAEKAEKEKAEKEKAEREKAEKEKAAAEKAAAEKAEKEKAEKARKQAQYERCKKNIAKVIRGCEKYNPNPKVNNSK